MKAKELIDFLETVDPDLDVVFYDGDRYVEKLFDMYLHKAVFEGGRKVVGEISDDFNEEGAEWVIVLQ